MWLRQLENLKLYNARTCSFLFYPLQQLQQQQTLAQLKYTWNTLHCQWPASIILCFQFYDLCTYLCIFFYVYLILIHVANVHKYMHCACVYFFTGVLYAYTCSSCFSFRVIHAFTSSGISPQQYYYFVMADGMGKLSSSYIRRS